MKKKKTVTLIAVGLALLFGLAVTLLVGKPMIEFVSNPEEFRAWVNAHGIWSRVIFVAMVTFQVIVALIPGEPMEIGGGYAFGAVEGTVLCVVGITLGATLVFALVRRFGIKVVEVFFSADKIRSLKFLQNEKRLNLLAFLIFAIPGTPKDLLTYFVGLTPMKFSTWLVITLVARLPSVISSTWGGSALNQEKYIQAAIVFGVTLLLSGIGYFAYQQYSKYRETKQKNKNE